MGIFKNMFKRQGSAGSAGANGPDNDSFNEELASFVDSEYQRRQTERRPFELQWRLNTEFLNGNQYLEINPITNAIEEIPKLFWSQEREVFNQIATIVETRMAKLSRQKPQLRSRPASSDDLDISAAHVTSMLLSSTWEDQDMDEAYEDFVSWLEITGTAFYKTTWNTRKGRVVYQGPPEGLQQGMGQDGMPSAGMMPMAGMDSGMQPELPQQPGAMPMPMNAGSDGFEEDDSEPKADPQTEEMLRTQQTLDIREGDIETVVVPAHEMFPDSSWRSDGLKGCRSIIHARAYHIDEIRDMWGVEVEPEDVDVMTLQRTASGMGGLGYNYGSFKTTVSRLDGYAVLKEYYEKPCQKYPQGRFIVVAGKKTLHVGPMPYQNGRDGEYDYPFERTVSIDRPGCFWGKTVLERCIPIQRRYNALRNRKAEYLNMVAIGQWYAPIGSIDEGTELTNAPGNVIHYRPGINGAKPEPVQWPSLPSSFEMEEKTLLDEFTAISGVSELSRFAQAPAGVKSGVALGIANEQDDTRIATSTARIANTSVALGKKWIRLYRQFVQEPRLLRYIGGNREVDVREWSMSDLRSDDVFIENLAALSETPSQRRQMVFDLLGAGLFNRQEISQLSEEGRQKVFQLLEFGHWETGAEDDRFLQRTRARNENRDMMRGEMKQVMDFDDHMLHVEQHNRMRMQSEYEELMKTPIGPLVNEMMMGHIAEHIQLALNAMPKQQPPMAPNGKPKEETPAG